MGSIEDVGKLQAGDDEMLAYTTQTTLSVDETKGIIEELVRRFPNIQGPTRGDLCYATTNRQAAVREMAPEVDVLLVIGSRTSSNTNRLRELGEKLGIPSFLLDSAEEADPAWFADADTIGITSGASAPESLVQGLVERIQALIRDPKCRPGRASRKTCTSPFPRDLV